MTHRGGSRRFAEVAGITLALVALRCSAATTADEGRLDDVEGGICQQASALPRAVAAAAEARRESGLAGQRTGYGSEAERREAFLRSEISRRAADAQDQIVADFRRQLQGYQAEYRRLTGAEFAVSQCDGPRVRVTHAQRTQRQKEQVPEAHQARMAQVLADGESYRQALIACDDWKILQRPAAEIERARPGYRPVVQARFDAFSSDFQRRTGRAFDTASCR